MPQYFSLLVCFSLIIGCGEKTVERERIVGIHDDTFVGDIILGEEHGGFGIKSIPKPIETADEEVGHLSAANLKIDAFQKSGSGFFISPDGHLLTNEHVLTPDSCTQSECSHLLVQNFTKTGPVKVFRKYQVIASNKYLDYTLVKVELQANEKVPFLELEYDPKYFLDPSKKHLRLLGHPLGATLQHTSVEPEALSADEVILKGLILGGNSGGPIIDTKTGKVVALATSAYEEYTVLSPESVAYRERPAATLITSIVNSLKISGHDLQLSDDWKLFKANENKKHTAISPPAILPRPNLNHYEAIMSYSNDNSLAQVAWAMFKKYVGSGYEKSLINQMFRTKKTLVQTLSTARVVDLLQLEMAIGRRLKYDKKVKQQLDTFVINFMNDSTPTDSTSIFLAKADMYLNHQKAQHIAIKKDCMEKVEQKPLNYFYYCDSLINTEGEAILGYLLTDVMVQTSADPHHAKDYELSQLLAPLPRIGITEEQDIARLEDYINHIESFSRFVNVILKANASAYSAIHKLQGVGHYHQ